MDPSGLKVFDVLGCQAVASDSPVAAVDFLDGHPGDLTHRLALDADHGVGQLGDHLALLVGCEDTFDKFDVYKRHVPRPLLVVGVVAKDIVERALCGFAVRGWHWRCNELMVAADIRRDIDVDLLAEIRAEVQGYIDVALWDVAGKVAGLPVHRMLGTCRDRLATQASSWVHGHTHTYAEEAAAYKAQGIRSYKLHPPTQRRLFQGEDVPLADDIEACALVREAVGEGYPLMLDSAWAYTYPDALKVGFAIEDLDYTWYEDPLPADDIYGYTRLKEQLSIPILATELTDGGLYALAPWVLAKATDYLRGDVVIKGGITGMMKIARLAEAFHLNCEVHDAYNALNNVATLNVVMAIDNCDWFEIITIHEPGSYDFEHLSYGLADPIRVDTDGCVHAPTAPGLGHAIDWDLINSGSPVHLT